MAKDSKAAKAFNQKTLLIAKYILLPRETLFSTEVAGESNGNLITAQTNLAALTEDSKVPLSALYQAFGVRVIDTEDTNAN